MKPPLAISWKDNTLYLLDQTRLPHEIILERQESVEQVWNSIKQLKVRGAPAIGIAGAYGLVVAMQPFTNANHQDFLDLIARKANYLNSARPTAVNLGWALNRMVAKAKSSRSEKPAAIYEELLQEAIQIHQEDSDCCHQIGDRGAALIENDMGILTHCNAGSLAVSELGTALAPMYVAHAQGKRFRVFADETRPLLQGARLTSWELLMAGLDVTLICDSMAAHYMSQGKIQMVLVGTDRVAANGDVANKIGTLGIAILAQYYSIPFYVASPFSTIDLDTPHGGLIPIEERDPSEVTHFAGTRVAPRNIAIGNPAFDITPHHLVKGFITEKGIISPPYEESLKNAFG